MKSIQTIDPTNVTRDECIKLIGNRAGRLCKLVELNAPSVIIENEMLLVLQAMFLTHQICCNSDDLMTAPVEIPNIFKNSKNELQRNDQVAEDGNAFECESDSE